LHEKDPDASKMNICIIFDITVVGEINCYFDISRQLSALQFPEKGSRL